MNSLINDKIIFQLRTIHCTIKFKLYPQLSFDTLRFIKFNFFVASLFISVYYSIDTLPKDLWPKTFSEKQIFKKLFDAAVIFSYSILKLQSFICVKVGPDDATFLLGTRDSVPIEHCSTLSQGVASASNNVG